jgi:hypothetical protein
MLLPGLISSEDGIFCVVKQMTTPSVVLRKMKNFIYLAFFVY